MLTVVKSAINLNTELTIETYNNTTITLPAGYEGDVNAIVVGDFLLYSRVNNVGSIENGVLTVDAMPAKQADLGEGKDFIIDTTKGIYKATANVYTFIINTVEELDMWQSVAADNSVKAELCLEEQKKAVLSGYIVLGDDIAYNKAWTPILNFGGIWNVLDKSGGIGSTVVDNPKAIFEDWGAGKAAGFQGVFDGKGHSIDGMTINGQYSGFIITMGVNGIAKNVAFTNLTVGSEAGLFERGGNGGLVENVYIELKAMGNGVSNNATKLISMQGHGHTNVKNIIVNVTNCDFSTSEYLYTMNLAHVSAENVYVIDRDVLEFQKANFTTSTAPSAFLNFDMNNDKGGKFATVGDLLADATHGAVVSSLGGYWSVVDGRLYFGDVEIIEAAAKVFDDTEYVNDVNHQITFENEAFTEGSVWTMSVEGVESEVTVQAAGELTVTLDTMAINAETTVVNFTSGTTVLIFTNVHIVTYIKTMADIKAIAMGGNNTTATSHRYGNYMLANNITFEHVGDGSDIIAAGYHAAGSGENAHKFYFKGVFDGNGFTIDNMRVSDGGIFGYADGATIRNVILTNVHLLDTIPAGISAQNGGYAAILAYTAPRSTFEDIQMTIASSPASVWTWKRDGLFVCSNSSAGATFRNITVDASYIELKTLLGTHYTENSVYENVLIKAANYAAIGYTADSYLNGVQNTEAMLTEFPAGVTFEKVVHVEIPNQPMNASMEKLSAYTGDETALGFAEGANVFEVVNSNQWNDRIVFPADSDTYDYVEFDVVPGAKTAAFTAWPSNGNGTQGSMGIYGAQMNTADGLVRTIQVWDANGNTFAAQDRGGFAANTFYTIRICFVEGETVKYVHFGTGTLQTYYVSNARWGTVDVENDVYDNTTGTLLPKYEGDVTALGFDAGSVVTSVTIDNDWSDRIGINGNIKYDFVDVEFAFSSAGVARNLCLWMYGTDSTILTGNYIATTAGGTTSNASERTIQVFNVDGSAVTESTFVTNKVYVLRVYLNGDASTFAVSTSGASEASTSVLCIGDITFGNEVALSDTVVISVEDGTFTLPDAIEGTIKSIMVDGVVVYDSNTGSLNGKDVAIDVALTAGVGKVLTVITDSDTYVMSATVKVPDVTGVAIQNTSKLDLTAYDGDTTAMGFKSGDKVYEITSADLWSDRILIPADSDVYDYVEFDVYLSTRIPCFTAWPSNGDGTQGSMSIYGAQMNTADGLVRTVRVWDANGNAFVDQYTGGFEANTFYTIRIYFVEGETVKYVHFAPNTAQTYYLSSARWGKVAVENDVYTGATGALLPKYEGDVTALGFDAGSVVTQATITDGWNSRVRVNANIKYDYVDVEWSFTGNRGIGSLCVWIYGTNGAVITGNYNVTANGGTPANNATERTIQIFDTNYNAVGSFEKDTVYILRVYLDGNASSIAVSTFDTSADNSAILNFGDITFGNAYESDEYVILETKTASYTLPDVVEGNVKKIVVNGVTIYDENTGSLSGKDGTYDVDITVGTVYEMVIYTEENNIYFFNTIAANEIITTADELRALGVGGMVNTDITANITGYYVLGNDIEIVHQDDFTDVFAAGYPKSGTFYFSGTFDGLDHTIHGVRVADGGIFGMMRNATVKNLNLTGVQYRHDAPATVTNQQGGYRALFAYAAPSSTFENIYVQVVYTSDTWDWKRDGVLVNTSSWGAATYRNITVDASGIKLRTLLGIDYSDSNVFENVVFKATGYVAIGYTGDSYGAGGVQNTAAMLTEFPAGVSFEFANGLVAQNNGYASDYVVYQGDVTALGFAEGTRVIESGIDTASGWDPAYATRAKVGYVDTSYDYMDIQFSATKAGASFTVWDGVNASYSVTATTVTPSKVESARTIQIFDANGDIVSALEANKMYTMRVYMVAANGDGINNFQITSTNAGKLYFGDVTFGNDITA